MSDIATDFTEVTEVAGEPISTEQLDRLKHRYQWALSHSDGSDVVELACGTGPGLGLLAATASTFEAGDYSPAMVARIKAHYGTRVRVSQFDAQELPFSDRSKDVLILFEALYYLQDATAFFAECRRVLRPAGRLLIATANKDLDDFNPSPHSHRYLGVQELHAELQPLGFAVHCSGYLDVTETSVVQRLLRPVKRLVVASGLMPKTMAGKRLLKRLVFGAPVPMPAELTADLPDFVAPVALPAGTPDRRHKVLYCLATLPA